MFAFLVFFAVMFYCKKRLLLNRAFCIVKVQFKCIRYAFLIGVCACIHVPLHACVGMCMCVHVYVGASVCVRMISDY